MEESVDEAVLELDMPDLATWTEPRTPNLAAMHPPLELYIVLFLRDSVMILAVKLILACNQVFNMRC